MVKVAALAPAEKAVRRRSKRTEEAGMDAKVLIE
jgi:hypothetical protein